MSKKQIYKPGKVKGFPEWLPEERMIELQWLDHIRRTFESYGFASIETPAVEELNVLLAKGETDKEIYTLTRLQQADDENSESRLGLHFDQTVPFARYTAQHFNELTFPFKRYQMQKVWRGERPQLGRMREFLQCDIDVINVDNLPLHFDAEIPAIIYEVLTGLDIGRVQIRISNRKILLGFLESLNIPSKIGGTYKLSEELKILIIREIDKLDKLGKELVLARIDVVGSQNGIGFNLNKLILPFFELCESNLKSTEDLENFITHHKDIDSSNEMLKSGIQELGFVLDQLSHLPEHAVKADLSIVRGLDYYTGTVYETRLLDIPEFTSSVCSGGRYDDLAGSYISKHLPGVGISIGFTRLFDVLRHNGYIKTAAKCPTDILVVIPSEEQRDVSMETARTLRSRGLNVETYHAPQKIGKQVGYAEKKGIPYVWFPPFDKDGIHEVKNMLSGEQEKAEVTKWTKS